MPCASDEVLPCASISVGFLELDGILECFDPNLLPNTSEDLPNLCHVLSVDLDEYILGVVLTNLIFCHYSGVIPLCCTF